MSETLRGGANAIHAMLSLLMVVTTSDDQRKHLVRLVEDVKKDLGSMEKSEEAREQFSKTLDLFIHVLKEWPSYDESKTDEPQ